MHKNTADVSNAALMSFMEQASEGFEAYNKGSLLLTDDKAPVELLGMKEIDGLIRDEVGYYRDIYNKYGLQGLMQQL